MQEAYAPDDQRPSALIAVGDRPRLAAVVATPILNERAVYLLGEEREERNRVNRTETVH